MHHVVFEVLPAPAGREPYLAIAARLRPLMEASGGCLALERFDRDDASGWMLSMQRWADETALARWRAQGDHCAAQRAGRERLFADYRLRVATHLDGRVAQPQPAQRLVAILEWSGAATAAEAVLHEAPAGSLRYTAILDRERHALVTPTASDAAAQAALAAWCKRAARAFTASALPFTRSFAKVDRDYGPVDRAQAPVALA